MTQSPEPARQTRRRAHLKWAGSVFAIVAAVLIAMYVSTPYLVSTLGPHIAKRFGLDTLEISVGRPGWTGLDVKRLVIESDGYRVVGENGRVGYSWSQLRKRQIDQLTFVSVDVSVSEADDTASKSGPSAGLKLPSHPFQQLRVERLVLRLPDTGFVGAGSADIDASGLSIILNGIEPVVASQFTLRAALSRDGDFEARFGERDEQPAEFLRLRGMLGDAVIKLSGDVNLTGYPLRLVSAAVQLPPGLGTVAGRFDTQLALPLPDTLALSDMDMALSSIAIDWIAEDKTLKLDNLSGSATLAQGRVTAWLSGDVHYQTPKAQISAHLPPRYQLDYENGTLTGTDGLSIKLTEAGNYAHLTLRSFSFTPGIQPRAHVDGDLDVLVDDVTVQGEIAGGLIDTFVKVDTKLDVERKPVKTDADNVLRGRGSITTTLLTQVPSPWPETLSWRAWDADLSAYAIDWQSANKALTLEKIRGTATLEKGIFTASTQGTANYRINDRKFSARFPKGYGLQYKSDSLTGGAGLTLGVHDNDLRVNMKVRSISLRHAPRFVLEIDGQVAGKVYARDTIGKLRARVRVDEMDSIRASGQLSYDGWLDTPIDRQDVRLVKDFSLRSDRFTATGKLTTDHFADLPFDLSFNTATNAGNLNARHTFSIDQPVVASFIKDWKKEYDFDGGQVATVMKLSWSGLEAIAASITLEVSGGQAFYDDIRAAGIAAHLELHADDVADRNTWQLKPSDIHVAGIDAGIVINDLRLGLAWSADVVTVSHADAAALGGQVRAEPFVYDLATGTAKIQLALDKLSLSRVLALEGDDLVGTGLLSGTLPVSINDHRLSISDGQLVAESPGGVLRLTSKIPSPKEQASLNFALNALRNYTYTSLRAQINYAENGDLALAVQLEGRNPDVEKGRPIHYNLNVTENVPVLLQSLRLQKELTRRIEKKIIK